MTAADLSTSRRAIQTEPEGVDDLSQRRGFGIVPFTAGKRKEGRELKLSPN